MIGGFRRENQNCTLLGYYAASSGKLLPMFRDGLSDPISGFKNSWILKMETIGSPEKSLRNNHYSLRNNPEEFSCHLS